MRMMFMFLLLMNVLFFAWQYRYPQQTTAAMEALPADLASIRLIRETAAAIPLPAEKVESDSVLPPASKSCYTLGPNEDEQVVEAIRQKLQAVTAHLTIRVIEESQLHRYWVYLKVASYEEAVTTSKLLAQNNISDYFIMSPGADRKISLGHFKEKAYADRREQQLKQLGFPVETEVIYHHFKLFWLDYEVDDAQRDQVKDLIAPYLQNEISILNRECEKIVY